MRSENTRVKWWERGLVRGLGTMILRRPSEDWLDADPELDYLMIFHFCPTTRQYRFDRHYDALSHSEHFTCGGCGAVYHTHRIWGCLALQIKEATLLSRHYRPVLRLPAFFRFFVFGLGKHTPETRGGKTTGELEREVVLWIGSIILFPTIKSLGNMWVHKT